MTVSNEIFGFSKDIQFDDAAGNPPFSAFQRARHHRRALFVACKLPLGGCWKMKGSNAVARF
ncbi:MAG: hypothetical protein AAFN70_07975 [Planctomycetota bacterium]